ncbi:MAG TPA: hypothetical protein VN493_12005 [Thermoanaerobaculia bacterium]|nr:hypothetical protein [Thermoanaerobaculia bacterium]
MRKACVVAFALLFVSVAGFAQTPKQVPLTREALATILGSPAGTGSCAPQQQSRVLFAAEKRPPTAMALCDATANCWSGGTVFCEDNTTPANCTAVDHNCSIGEPGHVSCNGVTTWCSACQVNCNVGTPIERACCRCDQTPNCMDCCRCEGNSLSFCHSLCFF